MLGILLASHGTMATGMLSSAELFFGKNIECIDTITLEFDKTVDTFEEELSEKITALDSGDGVLILADLFGGTPCNLSSLKASDSVHVISGANLTMLLEVLGAREAGNIDFDVLKNIGKDGIIYINNMNTSLNEDDIF